MITGLVQNSQSSRSFNSEVSGQNFESPYSVDLWAIGIFIYELTQGEAPFKDPKETVKVLLNHPTNTVMIILISSLQGIRRVRFTKPATAECQKIVTELCAQNPVYRLGYSKQGFKEIRYS